MATTSKATRAKISEIAASIPHQEETIHAAHAAEDTAFAAAKRDTLAAWVGLVVSGITGYWAGVLVQYLSLGVLLMTGSAFLSFMTTFLGIIGVVAIAIMVGNAVQVAITQGAIGKSVGSVVLGSTRAYYSARDSVASMFNRKGVTT